MSIKKSESNNESFQLMMLDSCGDVRNVQDEEQSSESCSRELSNFRVIHNYSLAQVPDDDSQSNTPSTSSISSVGNFNIVSTNEESLSNKSSDADGSGMTTLELHPNVILGIASEDDDSNSNGIESDRPHQCSICRASYKTKTHLRRHMCVHMRSKLYPCPSCEKGFNRKEHLVKHLEAVHGNSEKHICPFCDRGISRIDHLKRHIATVHRDGKSKNKKAAVLKVHLANGSKQKAQLSFLTPTFDVGSAGQTIITPIPMVDDLPQNAALKSEESDDGFNHTKIKATAPSMTIIPSNLVGPGEGVATLAIQSTPTQKVLVHQRLPSGSKVDLSSVTKLQSLANLSLSLGQGQNVAAFSSDDKNIKKRGSSEVVKVVQIFNCGGCSASFQTEQELATHLKSHKPHRCPECPRAYTRREKLNEHIRCFHEGQKFKCDHCDKSLSRKDHVLRHMRSVHPEAYAANFAGLDESNVTFDDNGRLVSASIDCFSPPEKRHRLPRTFTIPPSVGDVGVLLRSVCHVCLKVFGTAYHLTRHMESCHNGDTRPFRCEGCDKMFKRKDHLTKHAKAHCPNLKVIPQNVPQSPMEEDETKEKSSQSSESYHGEPHLSAKEKATQHSETSPCQPVPERTQIKSPKVEQVDNGNQGNLRLLADESESMSSSNRDCAHMILHNLQVEMDESNRSDNPSSIQKENIVSSTETSHSQQSRPKMAGDNEFSVAVIDSFMQGNVNVVVVDEEISSFLQQSSASHMTTTFPCGQCQKEFSARDLLIAHLQEHENDNSIHGDHDQRISDISFSDF